MVDSRAAEYLAVSSRSSQSSLSASNWHERRFLRHHGRVTGAKQAQRLQVVAFDTAAGALALVTAAAAGAVARAGGYSSSSSGRALLRTRRRVR